jgi:hypothetical protein
MKLFTALIPILLLNAFPTATMAEPLKMEQSGRCRFSESVVNETMAATLQYDRDGALSEALTTLEVPIRIPAPRTRSVKIGAGAFWRQGNTSNTRVGR